MKPQISLAIPHYNNSDYIYEAIQCSLNDYRVSEIIICDDNSQDIYQLKQILASIQSNKIKLYENDRNLGCYHNKIETISKCTNDWAILLDSDNVISTSFIDILYNIPQWDYMKIYAPSVAETFPNLSSYLNYERFSNKTITKEIYFAEHTNINFQCLINNCNYFLPVKQFLSCMKPQQYDRRYIDSLDSAVLFTEWLCANNTIFVVENLRYRHRLHPTSNYNMSNSRQYESSVRQMLLDKLYINPLLGESTDSVDSPSKGHIS